MDRSPQHLWFDPLRAGNPACCQQLGELPADVMDGGYQSDQQGGICHLGNEERNDGDKGSESQRKAKKTAIQQVYSEVVTQVALKELFVGRGECHSPDCTPGEYDLTMIIIRV